MSEKIKLHDFIEVEYTGKLMDRTVFDTTSKIVAVKNKLPAENREFKPATICVGERQLLPGLDEALIDREIGKEYTIALPPEKAFGKRDIKRVKIVPMSTFREHKLDPYPGLQVDMDGQVGLVTNISGGRVIVNFNHPLAGKEVQYEFTITKKIIDDGEKLKAYMTATFHIPADKIQVEIKEEKAIVQLPVDLPVQLSSILVQKLQELIKLKEITFVKEEKKVENPEQKKKSNPEIHGSKASGTPKARPSSEKKKESSEKK